MVKGRDMTSKITSSFWIYLQMHPELTISPFLHRVDAVGKSMVKFRVGCNNLPIETGRWNRTTQDDQLCRTCGIIGNKDHVLKGCSIIGRSDLVGVAPTMSTIWQHEGVS